MARKKVSGLGRPLKLEEVAFLDEQPRESLFQDRLKIRGSEIKFRAVCALGWTIYRKLADLRNICGSICDGEPSANLDAIHWIDYIETEAIDEFAERDVVQWPFKVSQDVSHLATNSSVKTFTGLVSFLEELANEVTGTEALNPSFQLTWFNSRGFALATELINDSDWSTDFVRSRWAIHDPHKWVFRENSLGNFQPVTVPQKDCIELRVNTAGFEVKNALLFYLTLEFQMMHEYVSHLLPVWNSGNALEEEFLLALMFLYYRERVSLDGIVSLVYEADSRRADTHRRMREMIKHDLAPQQEQRLSQILLELAVLDESEMKLADKRHLLALLRKIPFQNRRLQESIQGWIRDCDVAALYSKLKAQIA
jgi:hypothetical protein